MRFVNEIFTTTLGETVDNASLRDRYEAAIHALPLNDAASTRLQDAVQYFLIGQRSRQAYPGFDQLRYFQSRAAAFESVANQAVEALAAQIIRAVESQHITFDAVLTTTSTGNLMPGLSYRMAACLGDMVRTDSTLLDLGNVGCTGSLQAVHLARSLDPAFQHMLVVAVEAPTTLADLTSTDLDVWQGNCTFGDGAAAVWISSEPDWGSMALALEDLQSCQQAEAGLDLIHWGYGNYYTFRLANEKTFNRDVGHYVSRVLSDTAPGWREEPRWVIHPAGIALLLRLARKLGIPKAAMQPSLDHYKRFSNMSSASILYVLQDVAAATPVQSAINLLTMGAGFNVIYGRVRKER